MDIRIRWRLRQVRLKHAGLRGERVTQEEVFKATRVSVTTQSALENNQRGGDVSIDTAERLARFYGVPVTELYEVEEVVSEDDAEGNPSERLGSRREETPVSAFR